MTSLDSVNIENKKVLVRADLDLPVGGQVLEDNLFRLETLIPTLEVLAENNCDIVLIGHRGRPSLEKISSDTLEVNESLSLGPVRVALENILKEKWGEKKVKKMKMRVMDNLRLQPGEKKNDEVYAKRLAENGEFFINEAFAVSHRKHASIVTLPKFLPHAAGLRFVKEIENLGKLRESVQKPSLAIVGGVKEEKLEQARNLARVFDKILVAGRLSAFLSDDDPIYKDDKFVVGKLLPDNEDITIHSIEEFEEEVSSAKTIYVAGPIGKFEEEGHRLGTERIFEAVADSSAFKVAGGGDTISALSLFGLLGKLDWVSVGGGASLEFLATGTLPGIEALQ